MEGWVQHGLGRRGRRPIPLYATPPCEQHRATPLRSIIIVHVDPDPASTITQWGSWSARAVTHRRVCRWRLSKTPGRRQGQPRTTRGQPRPTRHGVARAKLQGGVALIPISNLTCGKPRACGNGRGRTAAVQSTAVWPPLPLTPTPLYFPNPPP